MRGGSEKEKKELAERKVGGREERQENPASLEKVYSCRLFLRVLYVHPALSTSSLEV
jgi:hypothetical protein